MKDYNVPPTAEFKMITESGRVYPHRWFTMMKAVMNDYWFDHPTYHEYTSMELDHLFHKLYYCWLMMGQELFDDEE